MRALDLFCGAGGVSKGLANAGFTVEGVDIENQPNYPFERWKTCAIRFLKDHLIQKQRYDFYWASPPCQAFTAYKRRKDHVHPKENLIPVVRELLERTGRHYVIENVGGAPLIPEMTVKLCGSMFRLDVQRHRFFENTWGIKQSECNHSVWTPRFAPATNRKNLRKTVEVGVWRIPLEVQQKAMGIDWMNLKELSQAIPPAYSEHIGKDLIQTLNETHWIARQLTRDHAGREREMR